jgi:ADP-ribosylglycohydrolase
MGLLTVPPETAAAMAKACMHDRVVGTLFGSALGDAIGLYTEFLSGEFSRLAYPSQSFTLHPASTATPFFRDKHRSPNVPGEWTDDTDHALLILLSYLHADGKALDPQDFAKRLHIWVQMGLRALDTLPLGLGFTVGAIVRSKDYIENPEARARSHWKKDNYNAASNGSLMRTHPLGLMCLDKTVDETFQVAADFSVVTHVDPRCIISCVISTALVRGLVLGEVTEEEHINMLIEQACQWWSTYREQQLNDEARSDEPDLDIHELLRHTSVGTIMDLGLDDIHKIGYVYKCLGSGIHVLRLAMRRARRNNTSTPLHTQVTAFEPLITNLIMQGGDADTNACFAGALLGAYLGYKALPSHWRDGLVHGEWLMAKAEALSVVVGVHDGDYSGQADKDTAPDGGRGFLTPAQMDEKVMVLQAQMAARETEWRRRESERKRTNSSR